MSSRQLQLYNIILLCLLLAACGNSGGGGASSSSGVNGDISVTSLLTPGTNLSITVNDPDLNQDISAAENVTVTVVNNGSSENEEVLLTETGPDTGIFNGSLATSSGSAGVSNDGIMNVEPGDTLIVTYQDILTASGSAGITTASSNVIASTFSMIPESLTPGTSLTITINDPDLNISASSSEAFTIVVTNVSTSETESVSLTETGPDTGIFSNTLITAYGTTADGNNNGILKVFAGNTIRSTYQDAHTASGGAATYTVSSVVVGGTNGTLTMAPANLIPGSDLTVSINDADLNTDPASVDSVSVNVTNNTTAENEIVLLTETGANTGIFSGTVSTVLDSAGPDNDGTINVQVGNTLTALYDDTVSSTGAPATRTSMVIVINSPPVAMNDSFTVVEDSTTILNVLDDNGNGVDSDADNDTLTIISTGPASNGGSITVNGNKTALIYTPVLNVSDVIETFSYTISDGNGNTGTAIVSAAITPVNDIPVAMDDSFTIAEDTGTTLNVLADNGNGADSDVEDINLTIISVGSPDQGGNAIINGSQTAIDYFPAVNFFGTETFTYTISDSNGATDTATVTVTVTPVDDSPVAVDDTFDVERSSTNNTLSVLTNDIDVDVFDIFTITDAGTPDKGGNVVIDGSQTALTYTPVAGFIGTETFNYTITDGHGGSSTGTITVHVAITEDFSGSMANWSVVNESDKTANWSTTAVSGELHQLNGVESISTFISSYHIGTYAYYNPGLGLTNYRFSVNATFLGNNLKNDIGVMFRYQNNNNYYRLSMNTRYGFTRLEKKVGGIFIPLAVNAIGYNPGQLLTFTVDLNGSLIQVMVNGNPLFAVNDSDLTSGTVALYTQGNTSFDNVLIQAPSSSSTITIASPVAQTVNTGSSLTASAIATNVPTGGGVEFLLDGSTSIMDTTFPYSATYSGISKGDHTIDAIVRNAGNAEITRDTNSLTGMRGDYYIAIGDSITNGEGDFYSADNETSRILGVQGYEANLGEQLENTQAKPVMVYNEGIGGDESADAAFSRIDSILDRHVGSNKALVMLGTNDALANIPPGTGCSGAACNGTFKGNMQSLINTLNAAGKTVYVAKVPPVFGGGSPPPYSNPSTATKNTNYVQPYNGIIDNDLTGAQPAHPDFYGYFLGAGQNRFSLFANVWHPNSLGHAVMASLWHNTLNPGSPVALPFVLDNLVPSTTTPYVKQNLIETGDNYYVDENYTINAIPAVLDNGVWIMTNNAATGNTSSSYITFSTDRDVTVYIAYDADATALPNWMSSYTNTGLTVGTTNSFSPTLDLYSHFYNAGPITLGGNLATGASGANSNYIVIVVPI